MLQRERNGRAAVFAEGVRAMAESFCGGCLCGAVRYRVTPTMRFRAYACHCTDCQTRSGSAFAIQLGVLASDLAVDGAVIRGEHVQPSGAVASIYACRTCLTRLYTTNDRRAGMANLRAGTLDASRDLVPAAHLWVASKLAWVAIPDDAIIYDRQPADAAEWLRILAPQPVAASDV
jgi:hypothetical protein